MFKMLLFLILFALIAVNEPHSLNPGGCSDIPVQPDFDYNKFVGTWYAIKKTKNKSTCVTYTFDDDLTVIENTRPLGFSFRWFMENFSQTGTVTLGSAEPAKMTIAFPVSLIPYKAWNQYVTLTDYDNYAVLWSCNTLTGIQNFEYIMLLARHPSPDTATVNLMLDHVKANNMSTYKLRTVDHQNCEYNIPPRPRPTSGQPRPTSGQPTNPETEE